MAAEPNKIIINSIDADDCVFNKQFIASEDKSVTQHNQILLAHINKEIEEGNFNKVYSMSGSNRQSYDVDVENSWPSTGSFFNAIAEINDSIKGAVLDSFLMADLFNDLEYGTAYTSALEIINTNRSDNEIPNEKISRELQMSYLNKKPQPRCKVDTTKVTILYAQMHRAAMNNPNSKVMFNFYDDKLDILNSLKDFFNRFKEIPKNVTLRLYQYKGGPIVKPIATIEGSCIIDENFQRTVKNLNDFDYKFSKKVGVASLINREPELLETAKNQYHEPSQQVAVESLTTAELPLTQTTLSVVINQPKSAARLIMAPPRVEILPRPRQTMAPAQSTFWQATEEENHKKRKDDDDCNPSSPKR